MTERVARQGRELGALLNELERLEVESAESEAIVREFADQTEAGAADSASPADPKAVTARRVRLHAAAPREAIVVSDSQVRAWAKVGVVPRAHVRRAEGDLPAGLEVDGGGAWIPGLEDGDRLVAVNGQAVSEREQVVRLVLEARGRGEAALTATFARRTNGGVARFDSVISQPYDR